MRDDRDAVARRLLEEAEQALDEALAAFGSDRFPLLIARHRRAIARLAALQRAPEAESGPHASGGMPS